MPETDRIPAVAFLSADPVVDGLDSTSHTGPTNPTPAAVATQRLSVSAGLPNGQNRHFGTLAIAPCTPLQRANIFLGTLAILAQLAVARQLAPAFHTHAKPVQDLPSVHTTHAGITYAVPATFVLRFQPSTSHTHNIKASNYRHRIHAEIMSQVTCIHIRGLFGPITYEI